VAYISITTDESANAVWGLDYALDNGVTEVKKWESLSDFLLYLAELDLDEDEEEAENQQGAGAGRPRRIALYTEDGEVKNDLNVDPDTKFIILQYPLLMRKTFESWLARYIESTGVSPTFRAVWFEENPPNPKRQDIRDLLITLIKI
jgi:hypothetical protein